MFIKDIMMFHEFKFPKSKKFYYICEYIIYVLRLQN